MASEVIEDIWEKARRNKKKFVLPEGLDDRIIKAASLIIQDGLGTALLLGDPAKVKAKAKALGVSLEGAELIDPLTFDKFDKYVGLYLELRKDKRRVSEAVAKRVLSKPVYLGAMMVKVGDADAMVAGAATITATIIRAGELIIGLQEKISVPSSFFLMDVPKFDRPLFFADAAVNPDPTADQLADIAIATGRSYKAVLGAEPKVAMLSFSTKGSASHPLVDKVVEATKIAKVKAPELVIDGELQADAALIPEIAERKLKEPSQVAGRANVLIFPDLNSGNIAYKLVQHLAKARAYGPILQGFKKPISDLSRGATVKEILGVIAILGAMNRTI